jgi:hypothetical protein
MSAKRINAKKLGCAGCAIIIALPILIILFNTFIVTGFADWRVARMMKSLRPGMTETQCNTWILAHTGSAADYIECKGADCKTSLEDSELDEQFDKQNRFRRSEVTGYLRGLIQEQVLTLPGCDSYDQMIYLVFGKDHKLMWSCLSSYPNGCL